MFRWVFGWGIGNILMNEVITFQAQDKQRQFLESAADIAIYGGAAGPGKTWALLYEPISSGDVQNKDFGAVILRRTYPEIEQKGGLWDESEKIYPYVGAVPRRGDKSWKFPSGATVEFRHMENLDDRYKYMGSQIPLIEFDQLEGFEAVQFFYMMSRNRSMCGTQSRIRASANAQPGWLADMLSYWINQDTGYAIPEYAGKRRWFVRIQDSMRWADKKADLIKKYPKSLPKSVEFYPGKLQDNKILMEKDPSYLSSLMALPLVDRERLLGGNWKIAVAGNIFKREWWKFVDRAPDGIIDWCRFWDCAATEQSGANDPDWTAGAKLGRDKNGNIYITDCQHFRGTPLENEKRIMATAQLDGTGVRIRMEQEPGASGKSMIDHYARSVIFGFDFAGKPSLKKKILRWAPLSAACEQGRVFLVKGSWNQDFVDELEGCKGEEEHNDQADAASGSLEELAVGTGAFSSVGEMAVTSSAQSAVDFTPIGSNFFG